MKHPHHPLVIGNWKMNPQSLTMATRLAADVKKELGRIDAVEVVIAPPFPYLAAVRDIQKGDGAFILGAQNTHHEKLGAHTGEVALSMLKSFDVRYVIIGHSERREGGETNADVRMKTDATLGAGLHPVVCVGEKTRDQEADYLTFIETEVREALGGIPKTKLSQVVIAYEPIWAIGTGINATPEDAHEVKLFIQRVLSDLFGRTAATHIRVLYGGSVNGKNAGELMERGEVDGFLVGGSSLNASEFVKIVKAAQAYG